MNKSSLQHELNRRRFLSQILPACSLVCLGTGANLWGLSQDTDKSTAKDTQHKFDQEFPRKLTIRQLMEYMYSREFIPFVQDLEKEIGHDKVIRLLQQRASARGTEVGALFAKQSGANDFATWKKVMSPENPNFKISLTFDITESTDKVHELKVTECLWAEIFLKANAGTLGNAAVCHGDYTMVTGFNPKITMVRNKTLTQGHDCCNHRYILGV